VNARTPKNALDAFDALTKAGFATLDQGLDAIEARLKSEPAAEALSVTEWCDLIKLHAGTDLVSLRKASPRWRGSAWEAQFRGRHVVMWQPMRCHEPSYQADIAAFWLLETEDFYRKADIARAFKRHRDGLAEAMWAGRDNANAFDWYVLLVETLTACGCTEKKGRASRRRSPASPLAQGGAT
jgi:hypothetical protein